MFLLSFEGIQRLKNLNYVGSVFQLVYVLLYWLLLLLSIHLVPSDPGWVSQVGLEAAWTGWMDWGQQGQGFGAEFNALHNGAQSLHPAGIPAQAQSLHPAGINASCICGQVLGGAAPKVL